MEATSDPHVFIEEKREGYVRYRQVVDGEVIRRWEVHGTCDRRGDCLIGAYIEGYGHIISHRDLDDAKRVLGRERIDSELDVPVTPEFRTCCGVDRFRYVELDG
jgi:hypothetical protein